MIEANTKFKDILENIAQAQYSYGELAAEIRAANSRLQLHITTENVAGHEATKKSLREEGSRTRRQLTRESNFNSGLILQQGRANRTAAAKHKVAINQCIQLEHVKTRSILQNEVRKSRKEEVGVARWTQLICSLKFPEMNTRRNQILDPHCRTFDWIFKDNIGQSWDSFNEFLEHPASIFWIKGKAGSGKSSLMRFISEHDKCHRMLDLWSAPTKTVILSWYFWNSGTEFQKSLKGALCSLTHQALSQVDGSAKRTRLFLILLNMHPSMASKESIADWSVAELMEVLQEILSDGSLYGHYVAIFLDGLDEFNSDEDIGRLLDLVKRCTRYTHIKACVSSRPEKHLEVRLSSYHQLKLEDLTADDIQTVVFDRLRSSASDWDDSQIQNLAGKIRERASGVFLWVQLVTDQLARGLLHGDSQQILTERLAKLPPKMESLYEHMWRSLNGDENLKSYRRQAAECLAFHQVFPMTVLELAVALDDDLQHNFIDGIRNPSEVKSLLEKCAVIGDLLKTRCAGLLEIPSHGLAHSSKPSSKDSLIVSANGSEDREALFASLTRIGAMEINFIHRSAKDFLLDTAKGQQIQQYCTWTKMDVVTRVANAYLQRNILGLSALSNANGLFNSKNIDLDRLVSLVFNNDDILPGTAEWQYSLLKNIDSVYSTRVEAGRRVPQTHWQQNWYFYSSERKGKCIDFWGSIAKHFSEMFCKQLLSHGENNGVISTYFLACVCWEPDFDVICSRNLHAMYALLDHGADPNSTCMRTHQDHGTVTPWLRFLRLARRAEDYSGIEAQLASTIEKFIESGASLSAIAAPAWQYTVGEFDCFEALMGLDFHEIGEAVFEVNAAYWVQKIRSRINDPIAASKLQFILDTVVPTRRITLVRGGDGRWFAVEPDDAEGLLEMVLDPRAAEVEYGKVSEYVRQATVNGVVVKPRAFLAARDSISVCPRTKILGGLEHLRRAAATLQAGNTVSWLAATWARMANTSVFANGFSEIPPGKGRLTRFTLLEDVSNNLASFNELYGQLHELLPDTDEFYSTLPDIWQEVVELRDEEAAKLAAQDLVVFDEEVEELHRLFCIHGLEQALEANMNVP